MVRKSLARVVLLFALALVAVASYWAGFLFFFTPARLEETVTRILPRAEEPPEFRVFWEAWSLVEEGFDGPTPDPRTVTYGALRGMLFALDDPNTFFNEPPAREREEERLEGRFGGVGLEDPAQLSFQDGNLVVVAPLAGSPAQRVGILPGDVILALDDHDVEDLSFEQAIDLLKGPVGSQITLTTERQGQSEPLIFTLQREEIKVPTVIWRLEEPDIGYVKISLFGENTEGELRNAIQELLILGARGFVLDLRDNPGGIVEAAVDTADQFIPSGVILYQVDGQGQEKVFSAEGGSLATDSPLVVLVNEGTASAAEIVAGALRDHGRALLVGEATFGKGTVQNIHELSDGSSIHVTVAHWLTPDRFAIDVRGLAPDIEVATSQHEDLQLARALAAIRTQISALPWPTVSETIYSYVNNGTYYG